MNKRDLIVSSAVLALCAGLLVLFTDIEVSLVRWINCGPLAGAGERRAEICR